MDVSWEFIIAVITAVSSMLTSAAAIKRIVKHESIMCDKRMEAFKEGLDRSEGKH